MGIIEFIRAMLPLEKSTEQCLADAIEESEKTTRELYDLADAAGCERKVRWILAQRDPNRRP